MRVDFQVLTLKQETLGVQTGQVLLDRGLVVLFVNVSFVVSLAELGSVNPDNFLGVRLAVIEVVIYYSSPDLDNIFRNVLHTCDHRVIRLGRVLTLNNNCRSIIPRECLEEGTDNLGYLKVLEIVVELHALVPSINLLLDLHAIFLSHYLIIL